MVSIKTAKAASKTKKAPAYAAPALDKGMDILEALVEAESGLTKAEISQRLNRNLSEVFRMIVTLERRGWLFIDDADRYHLSMRMFELATKHWRVRTITEVAVPVMQELAYKVGQSCHLVIAEKGHITVIAQVGAPGNLSFGVRIGSRLSLLDTASGLVLLAYRTPEQRQQLLEDYQAHFKRSPVPVPQGWQEQADAVKKKGYASFASYQVRGVTNICYPIFGHNKIIEAAMTIPYMDFLGAPRTPSLEDARTALAKAAHNLSSKLGYLPNYSIRHSKQTESGK